MEDEEGAECGKADFVLLDQVTMEDFMENLKLRWAQAGSLLPGPSGGGEARAGVAVVVEGGEGHTATQAPIWAWVTAGGPGSQAGLTPRDQVAGQCWHQLPRPLPPTQAMISCPAPKPAPRWVGTPSPCGARLSPGCSEGVGS